MHKLILFYFLVFQAFGQVNFPINYNLTTLNGDDGLSQVSNYFRYEDSRGFMWITANDALNRYDGSSVKVYNLNKYFKNCPNLQQGYGFAEDTESNIYVGSERGLYIYTRNTDKFTLQEIFKNSPDQIAMPFAFENGKIWCFNRFYELATYDVKTREVKLESKIQLDPLSSIHIYQIHKNVFYYRWPVFDDEKNIWLVGNNKVGVYNTVSKKTHYPIITKKTDLQNEFFASSFDRQNNDLYIGTNHGLLKYDTENNKIEVIEKLGEKKLGGVHTLVASNHISAFNSDAGFALLDLKTLKHQWMWPQDKRKTRAMIYFTFDKVGRLWLSDNGLEQKIIGFKEKILKKIPEDLESYRTSISNSVGYIVELPDKSVLVQGLWQIDKKNNILNTLGEYAQYQKGYTDPNKNGTWFLNSAKEPDAVLIFRDKNNRVYKYIRPEDKIHLGELQDVMVFLDDRVLLCGSNGLFWLDKKQNKILVAEKLPNAFKINQIDQNNIAVSYLNGDLVLYGVDKQKLTKNRHLLKGVQSFYLQHNVSTNQYWVGTNKGVFLLNKHFKLLNHFDANNGLAGTYIYGLLLDDEGNAWCSHQRGLSSINAKDYTIVNFDKTDGIQDWDFNNRSFLKGSDGTLYFGGVNGANYFKPPLKPHKFYKPEVYIDEIWVNEKSYKPEINADLVETINLDYHENNIALKAIVKDLELGKSHQIIYRISQKKDTKWIFSPSNSLLAFNSLSSGNYILELGVYDKFTRQKVATKKIKINISTPIYNRFLFWLFLGFLGAGVIFLFYNRQKSRRQKAIFDQELALEKQRTKITADLHDDIGSSLSSLQVNSAVAGALLKKDPNKAKIVLEKIEEQSKRLAETLGDLIWSMKPGKEEIIDFSTKIKNFANDILGSTHINYEIKIEKDINQYLVEIYLRKNLIYIAKEAINNAAKYSSATEFSLYCYKKNNTIRLEISDNGKGFDKNTTKGNGLRNIETRVRELNGTLELKTETNKGCQITVVIPLSLDLGTKS